MNNSFYTRNGDHQKPLQENRSSFRSAKTGLIQVPSLGLPKGGGAMTGIGETFKTDTFSGTANYSIPIPITKARGFEPRLTIDYNSGNGNSIFGMGFSLSLSKISIRTEMGIPKYDGSDIFLYDSDELVLKKQLPHQIAGWNVFEYLPRVQCEFSLIQHVVSDDGSQSYWKITTRENIVYFFGQSNESRIYDPLNPAHIFQWLIDESTDAKGNKIVYAYKAENSDNVPDKPWEKNRSYNNKYIHKIQFGNYTDNQGIEQFAFQLIFDYGEYQLPVRISDKNDPLQNLTVNPYEPVSAWKYRADSFSSYTSGFEIRTCRLCYHVMLFHFFENELGDPCLVKSLDLNYRQAQSYLDANNPGLSLLAAARTTGYRRRGKNVMDDYDVQQMPPVEFNFSVFIQPQEPLFKKIEIDGSDVPGYLNSSGFQPMDFCGEGIAGLLFHDDASVYYCSPEGDGEYNAAETPLFFPSDLDYANTAISLTDLDGNGELDLVVNDPQRNGYYLKKIDGGWQNYMPFKSYATNISGSDVEMAGLSNNGKTDAVFVSRTHIIVYPSRGTEGYGPSVTAKKEIDFPSVKKDYLQEYVGFADMMGDGLPHRVKITDGLVECWPDMGYGVFGKKITIGNAPYFGNDFDIRRLFLTDIDGSGTTDLVYVYRDKISVYINQSGNYFSDAITVDLPEPYSSADQISFSDVKGNGTNCLVYTKAGKIMQHWYYDFVGELNVDGEPQNSMKPYLLIEIDNNLGIANRIQYCSSTKIYLEDKRTGNPWCTKLPFPVQIIEKVSVIDKINKINYTSRFKFHDGFYDHVERRFIGFGFVETWDTETYQSIVSNARYQTIKEEYYVPPVYSRTWYQTGAGWNNAEVMANYKDHFFKGDTKAYDFPDSVFEESIYMQDSDTLRQAYLALQGQVLRTEVYANDQRQNPLLYQNPYTVTESNSKVFLYQEKGDQPYAVFLVVPRESISYNYERNPQDPRVQQSFTLITDSFGNPIESCLIYLSRRPNSSADFVSYPEQNIIKASLHCQKFVQPLDGFLFYDVCCEEQDFEIAGLQPDAGEYFSFEGIKKQITLNGFPDPSRIIPYNGIFTSGVQARQITWNRHYFWNWANPQQDPSLGFISSPALIHHTEEAVFTKEFTIDVFGGRLIDEAAYANGGYLSNIIYTHGGYFYNPADGYWWNKGLVQYYLTPSAVLNGPWNFYLPCKTENSFAADNTTNAVAKFIQDPSLNETTLLGYDNYYLFPVQVTQEIDSQSCNTLLAQIDYISGQPCQLSDINGNITQVLFDSLGQVIVSSIFGSENGMTTGGMTLYPNGNTKAEYQPPGKASFTDVITNPQKFLQGAGTYFYYNLYAWVEDQQPVCSINLVRNHYWHSPDSDADPYCQVLISYTDGLGQDIEKKQKAGLNGHRITGVVYERWQVTGRTVYNNKGKPCEQYQPYFTSFPEYEHQEDIPGPPPTVTYYDPLLRVIRIDTPKRFFSKVEFTPWEEFHYDEDDTILDSYFYQHEYPGKLNQNEIDAIVKAIKFYNTPSITVIDNKGSTFLQIKNNLGNVLKDAFKSLEQPGITSEDIWNNLLSNGYLAPYPDHPDMDLHFLTAKFQPYTAGFKLNLDPKYNNILNEIIAILKENCLTSFYVTDVSGRITESIDPRIYYGNIFNNSANYNFKYKYAMDGNDPVLVDSVDAGAENPLLDSYAEKHLQNIFGSQLWTWTPRSYCQLILYDRLQRKTALKVKKIVAPGPVTNYDDFNLVEVFTYGESCNDPSGYNLRGQLYQLNDLSGIVLNPSYTMLGQPLTTSRQMLADYKTAADWKEMLPLLQDEVYQTEFTYNAVKQMLTQTTPDGAVTSNTFNEAGLLTAVCVKFPANNAVQNIIDYIDYNANGQRILVKYGNGIITRYEYEKTTLRLTGIKSNRPPTGNNTTAVQDITYYYDPVGNITRTLDNTAEIIFCKNQRIDPLADYTYDAIYQLKTATGRQHIGITANTYQNNSPDSFKQCFFGPPPCAKDSDKLENYTANYTYDDSGNLIQIKHTGSATTSWSRDLPVEISSNRLRGRIYDASGNLRNLDISNDVDLSFNCCENLVRTSIIKRLNKPDDCDYYMYDSAEARTRKVCEKLAQGGALTLVEDKIYFGNFEIKRKIAVAANGQTSVTSELQTLRVMDDECCVAIIEYTVTDNAHPSIAGSRLFRFQMNNNIGSVCLEMNETAQLISYEEYFPYGGTAIITGPVEAEVKGKVYRYSGKECDDSTGLYYYGARYYVSWQGRWLNADPAGTVDGMNLFAFVGGNPISHADDNGTQKRSRRMAGLDPENEGLEDTVKRATGNMLSMRSKPDVHGFATFGYTPVDKSFKTPLRLHWKGTRSVGGLTTGIEPDITTRDSKAWTYDHVRATQALGGILAANPGFTSLDNGLTFWAAENSHIIAGSLWGANDVLSAPPASVHQNTEWLAIETGIKSLINNAALGGQLRLKATGYVYNTGPNTGFLKSARYKIYIGGTKVFDHVSLGNRGNIDENESTALKARVAALTAASPEVRMLGKVPKGLSAAAPPSLPDIKNNRTASASSPMFTGLTTTGSSTGITYRRGQAAFKYMTKLYEDR